MNSRQLRAIREELSNLTKDSTYFIYESKEGIEYIENFNIPYHHLNSREFLVNGTPFEISLKLFDELDSFYTEILEEL